MSDPKPGILSPCLALLQWSRNHVPLTIIALMSLITAGGAIAQQQGISLRLYRVEGEIQVQRRGERTQVGVSEGTELTTDGDALYVPRDTKSWTALSFVNTSEFVYDSDGMVLRTLPSTVLDTRRNFTYVFPCLVEGEFQASWAQVVQGPRQCDGGLQLVRPSELSTDSSWFTADKGLGLQPNSSGYVAQGLGDRVNVVPGQDYTLIEADTEGDQIRVSVVTGSILAQTSQNPQGVLVNAGQEYVYPSGQISSFNCRSVANSPSMQAFLNPAHWLTGDVAPSVAQGLTEHLQGQQAAAQNCPVQPEFIRPAIVETTPEPVEVVVDDIRATLRWSTADDLDLAITDPAGQQVSYRRQNIPSGGSFSNDDNQGCSFANPEASEDISWGAATAPNGQYTAVINLYSTCAVDFFASSTPYTLTVSIQGYTQTFTGTVSEAAPVVMIPFVFP